MTNKPVWLITGGTRGIGEEIYQECIKNGNIGIICARNIEPAKGYSVDVSKVDECRKMIDDIVKKYGRIDVLVNNAGIYGPIGKFEENENDLWEKTIKINLMGTVNCSSLVVPIMKKYGGGKIINLAGGGVGGNKSLARFTAYYTSKMAVVGFTESLAAELKEDNIQVNCIAPGGVNTSFTDQLINAGKEKAGESMYDQAIKQKESGGDSPQLAAKMAMFLASGESDHITGKLISAKWDKIEDLKDKKNKLKNIYNLRRIDNIMYYEK